MLRFYLAFFLSLSLELPSFGGSSQESFMELCLKRDTLPEVQRDFIDFLMTSGQCGPSLRRLEKIPILYFKDTYVEWSLLKEAESVHSLHLNSYDLESLDFLRGMRKLKNLIFEKINFSQSVDMMVLKQLPRLKTITIISSNLSDKQRYFLSRLPGIELKFAKKRSVFPS
ncbi:MAG: hypothetical protein AB8G05_16000 [Oligoflexales bacterium]